MNKNEFITSLSGLLKNLREAEREKAIVYYEEILADRIDDGMSEEEAVASLGDINTIAADLIAEMPLVSLMQQEVKRSRDKSQNKRMWVIAAVCGFPIWFPLLVLGAAMLLLFYVLVWTLIIVLFALEVSLAAMLVAGILGGAMHASRGNLLASMAMISAAAVCAGLFMLTFRPLQRLAKKLISYTSDTVKRLKLKIIKKGA